MKVAFIGFGEAAYCISLGLKEIGFTGIIAYDTLWQTEPHNLLIKSRAEESGVALCESPGEAAAQADIIFAAMPSKFGMDVCKSVLPYLNKNKIYADVSASTPKMKVEISELIEQTGAVFADAAMLGSLPADRHKVPIVASGSGAAKLHELMTPYEMQIEVVGEKAGDASAIKLVRSIFMKGIAALTIEMLQAAKAYGITDTVVSSVGKTLETPFKDLMGRWVTGTAIHAKRRGDELQGSVQMLQECGLDFLMSEAAMNKHYYINEFDFAGQNAKGEKLNINSVIDGMIKGTN